MILLTFSPPRSTCCTTCSLCRHATRDIRVQGVKSKYTFKKKKHKRFLVQILAALYHNKKRQLHAFFLSRRAHTFLETPNWLIPRTQSNYQRQHRDVSSNVLSRSIASSKSGWIVISLVCSPNPWLSWIIINFTPYRQLLWR